MQYRLYLDKYTNQTLKSIGKLHPTSTQAHIMHDRPAQPRTQWDAVYPVRGRS